MIDKYAARSIKQDIRRVLMDVWDPIGVKGIPNAHDEYDSYINTVFEWLTSGASDDDIAKGLLHIASVIMGLAPTLEGMRPTVQALRNISLDRE
jgi:hypothetical protein